MSNDIIYTAMDFSLPVRISGYSQNLAILQWFLQHSQAENGWITFSILTKSDGELLALKTVLPVIGDLKRDLQSQANILFHLSETKRFTAQQMVDIDALIEGWSPSALAILSHYWPGGADLIPVNTSYYEILANWSKIAYKTTLYVLFKARDAQIMIKCFKILQTSADLLLPLRNKMSIGMVSKQVCSSAGGATIDHQDALMAAIQKYFSHILEYRDGATQERFLQNLVPDLAIIEGGITQLNTALNGNRLYKIIIAERPLSLASWKEYGSIAQDVNDFFREVNTLVIDPVAQATNRLPIIRVDMAQLLIRVEEYTDILDEDTSLESILVLDDEVKDASIMLHGLYNQGLEFTLDNFGTDRPTLICWKEKILAKKKLISDRIKKHQKIAEVKSELYQKNIKTKALPDITRETWARFLSLWELEAPSYADDASRLSVVRARLTDSIDKSITEPYKTLADLMAYLFTRYGSPTSIMTSQLDKLECLPEASNVEVLERNLVQVGSAITLSTTEEHVLLWTVTRMANVMNQCLDRPTLRTFWTSWEMMKSSTLKLHNSALDGEAIAKDTWELLFCKQYTRNRLDFLEDFCNTQIAILRNMKIGQNRGSKKTAQNHG